MGKRKPPSHFLPYLYAMDGVTSGPFIGISSFRLLIGRGTVFKRIDSVGAAAKGINEALLHSFTSAVPFQSLSGSTRPSLDYKWGELCVQHQ